MPEQPPQNPLTHVRRHDRAVHDDEWIRAFLRRAPFGTLATAADHQPFLHTSSFVYDQAVGAVYFHGAHAGRTPQNLAANDRVCFSVSEMGRLLPAERAMGFSVEYAGVVIFGRASLVTDPTEARGALDQLMNKYFPHLAPGRHYANMTEDELAMTAVYRLDIQAWSGKEKQAPLDFPGAFVYGDPPESAPPQ
ncbi:MAG: pyridoxamine 5'-phosphate oxidase family protein [bacterium]|nr:pyridoxamine 5'-phosphate oxidase family protein [bacterium]